MKNIKIYKKTYISDGVRFDANLIARGPRTIVEAQIKTCLCQKIQEIIDEVLTHNLVGLMDIRLDVAFTKQGDEILPDKYEDLPKREQLNCETVVEYARRQR